jgi:hypothetical protein
MKSETLTIAVDDRDSVTALLYPALKGKRVGVTLVLGHGAGADQLSGFMVMMAKGLAARGCDVMTFNFVYKEQARGIPDPKARLESCYQAVIKTARTHKKLKKNRLVIGGNQWADASLRRWRPSRLRELPAWFFWVIRCIRRAGRRRCAMRI